MWKKSGVGRVAEEGLGVRREREQWEEGLSWAPPRAP
jgi:hypothetical protein